MVGVLPNVNDKTTWLKTLTASRSKFTLMKDKVSLNVPNEEEYSNLHYST